MCRCCLDLGLGYIYEDCGLFCSVGQASPALRGSRGHQGGWQEDGWNRSCRPGLQSVFLITKSIFSKAGGEGETKGSVGLGRADPYSALGCRDAVLAMSFWPCAPQKPSPGLGEVFRRQQLGGGRPADRETSSGLSFSLPPPELGSGQAMGLRQGQCDCRATSMALEVALTTATGSLAAGSTAGMSLGTLCMGRILGPSRVSRIPRGGRTESE